MTDIEVGRMIREQRYKLRLSQQQLAKKVGVTWEMVSRYERGKSSALQKIFELAEALEVDVNRFFGGVPSFPNFADASNEYLNSRFVPVLTTIPAEVAGIRALLGSTETGMHVYDQGEQIEKFAIRLGPESRIRIASGGVLPKGTLICTLALGELTEQSVILVARNGLVSVEQYIPEDAKIIVLARVLEWVVKL